MQYHEFSGSPRQLGFAAGQTFQAAIRGNIDILVRRTGYTPLPRHGDFFRWVETQRDLLMRDAPWLLEEVDGIAEGSGFSCEEILLLNLRAWQYEYYAGAPEQCSSLLITLDDGAVANAGALDDSARYYSGLVKVRPERGYAFITLPIAGTVWGNRGVNAAGLSLGVSSQLVTGAAPPSGPVLCADLVLRLLLQQCATVAEVKSLCRRYCFTVNLVAVDRDGGNFAAQYLQGRCFELESALPKVLTNHVTQSAWEQELTAAGITGFPECATTRGRCRRLAAFGHDFNGRCTGAMIREWLAGDADSADSLCPPGNIAITYADSRMPGMLYVASPRLDHNRQWECYSAK